MRHNSQERLKDSPDLLPVEELGLPGPLLVVGRETTLPSGAADLLALAPTGDLVCGRDEDWPAELGLPRRASAGNGLRRGPVADDF